jgi:predicted nucleotidyltransferase
MILYSKYKWNRAIYSGRQFSIHPVKLEDEVDERWEDKIYRPLGLVKVRARVIDSSNSIFMPAIYVVSDVKVLEGNSPYTQIVMRVYT